MAGGEGTRLRPLTSNLPKPMLPLVNRPMMEHVVTLLRDNGFDDIVVTLSYLPDSISSYFGDGREHDVRMTYSTEEAPLGTAGSVRHARRELEDTFLVISGDVVTDIDLTKLVEFHRERPALATMALVSVDNPLEFGMVITREDGSVERFLEKPSWGQVFSDTVNTGVFVLEPEIFDHIEPDRPVDFSGEVFPSLIDRGGVFGCLTEGYWEDVGTVASYLRAHKDLLDGRVSAQIPGFQVSQGVWVGEGAGIDHDARVVGPAVVGENASVEAGAVLGEYAVIGASVRLHKDCDLERSVVHDNAYLGEAVKLRGTVVGRRCDIRTSVRCEEGVVLGDDCFVGEHAVIGADVKVYPLKSVESGAVVNNSIIWESRGARSLFGRNGVSGLANVDMTPEFAAKVAMAFATTVKKQDVVVASRDSSRSARMLKRAMMAGFNACGVDVLDLEAASVPVTRFVCRRPLVSAGVTVGLLEDDPDSVEIRFFDGSGADIPEERRRKVERLFTRGDFRRVLPGEIGEIGLPPLALEHYAVALEHTIDLASVGGAGFKVVLDYSCGSTSHVMPNVLAKVGAEVLAVNPFSSTRGAHARDHETRAREVAALVVASSADLGAVLGVDGERLTVIDDTGRVLSHAEALLAMLEVLAERLAESFVGLPVNVTGAVEDVVRSHGGRIVWTKVSAPALMDRAKEPDAILVADGCGGFIVPAFLPAFDAAAALVLLMERLALTGRSLSSVVEGLPELNLVEDTVATPWEQKGGVMRELLESSKARQTLLVDGLKVFHDRGWVLILPDPEGPFTHLWAESESREAAQRLCRDYSAQIRQMVG
ncbi:MAG: Glucose-1-phosphate adenylyltransferase [Acidimicrobiales bacterium]|nr:Glucose-1-phosphate adenylyltransferase [Acidimicrobiales bacterium]